MTLLLYIQTIFNQLNIMVPYLDIIGLSHSVSILWEIYVMRYKWLRGGITYISSKCYLRDLVNRLWLRYSKFHST